MPLINFISSLPVTEPNRTAAIVGGVCGAIIIMLIVVVVIIILVAFVLGSKVIYIERHLNKSKIMRVLIIYTYILLMGVRYIPSLAS